MLEGTGKDTNGIAFERTQIDGVVTRRLHLQADAFQTAPGQLDLPACRQDRGAVGRLDQRVSSGIDGTAQQDHVATARQNPALHRDGCA